MPSHKTLKSVVRSLVESFTSLMNYRGNDYVMGHVLYAAWATGATELCVDLLTGQASPSPLLDPPVREGSQAREMVPRSCAALQVRYGVRAVSPIDRRRRSH